VLFSSQSCHAHRHRHNDAIRTATFQVLFTVSLFSAWNLTTVELDSGVTEKLNPPSAFVYFRWS